MVHQERQRKVFYILFTIFAIAYIIILAFIGATFKFIAIIAKALERERKVSSLLNRKALLNKGIQYQPRLPQR